MTAFVMIVSLGLLAGCTDGSSPPATSASSTSLSTTTTLSPALAPLRRAYTNLAALSSYAISMETWVVSEDATVPAVRADGAVRDKWLYLSLQGPDDAATVELALQDQTAVARIPGGDWAPASDVFTANTALQALPIEDPRPLLDVLPDILTKAEQIPLAQTTVPAWAKPAPSGSAEAFRWSTELLSGTTKMATVDSVAWLDERERLVRLDRETIPMAGAGVEHTYTSIGYSRFADPSLEAPVPPEGY
jgi:hypothetical protein